MITTKLNVHCDNCDTQEEVSVIIDPMALGIQKSGEKIIRRVFTFEYPEELKPKGWIAVEIGLTIKLYCAACKETMANEIDQEEREGN